MMPTQIGITLVCIMGLFLIGSIISGTFMYPKWCRGFFRKPRTNNKRVFWNDIHRLLGLWSLWLLIVICVTSVWYLIEIWGLVRLTCNTGKPTSALAQQQVVQPSSAVIDQAIKTTFTKHPNMIIKNIRFPSKEGQAIIIEGQSNTVLVRDRATNAVFDPVTADLLSTRFAQNLSVHVRNLRSRGIRFILATLLVFTLKFFTSFLE